MHLSSLGARNGAGVKNAERMGLDGAFDTQLKYISSLIIVRAVSPSEAAVACLQILMVQKSIVVKYIDSKSLALRTRMVTKSRILDFHPIKISWKIPYDCEVMTLIKYFKFKMDKIWRWNVSSFEIDMLDFHIYENHKVTSFTNFHPPHSSVAFFSTSSFKLFLLEMKKIFSLT